MSVNDYDEELYLMIEDLVDEGELEKDTPAYGISQQVIHQGYDSLTPRQKSVYDKIVVPALERLAERYEANRRQNSWPD